jgi:hypothetical protein
MGMVMLDGLNREVLLDGELGRQVFRMEVVGDDVRGDSGEPAEVVHGLQEGTVGGQMLQIADVVAGDDVRAFGHGHGVLELGPDGQHLTSGGPSQRDGLRRETPGATDHLHAPAGGGTVERRPDDRVVAADVDAPVVRQDGVHHRPQTVEGVGVVVGDGLVAQVAAGHDQRTPRPPQEQMVQRGVGEHDAQLG